jgi:hypothetical protein
MHIRPDPGACRGSDPTPLQKALFMTLTKEAITRLVIDRLDLSKVVSTKAVEGMKSSAYPLGAKPV